MEPQKKYNSLLKGLNISDEKIKTLILETFQEKFSYMDKMDYLRWINKRNLSERITKLTVELMTEEEKKEYPLWAGFYSHGTDTVKMQREYTDKHISDHELNHFLNDGVAHFPRFINEGITEFLTQNTVQNAPYVSYKENVNFIEFLYSIFGDEVIKCYLTGVTSEFLNKFNSYLKMNDKEDLKDFYDVIEEIHTFMHTFTEEQQKEERYKKLEEKMQRETYPKYKKYLENLAMNSVKEDFLNFKFYKDNKIDFKLLTDRISERINLLLKALNFSTFSYTSKDAIVLFERVLIEGLSNSYLNKFYTKEQIIELVNSAKMNEKTISLPELRKMDKESDDNISYAIQNRLNNNNYINGEGFDYSQFMIDFFSLINTKNMKTTDVRTEELLYTLLYKKLKGNVNVELVQELISRYKNLYIKLSDINLNNIKNNSESSVIDISIYKDYKVYLEKRDNNYFIIKYNVKTKKFTIRKAPFNGIERSYNKEYSDLITFRDEDTGVDYRISIDKETGRILFKGNEVIPQVGLKTILNNSLVEDITNIDYSRYIVYLNDGERILKEGVMYVGGGDEVDSRSRAFDIEQFSNDIRNKTSFFTIDVKNQIIKNSIENLLKKCYGSMEIPNELKSNIITNFIVYINQNKNDNLNKIEDNEVELVKLWREYQKNLIPTGLLQFKDDETRKKYFKTLERKEIDLSSKKFTKENYLSFIIEENEDYFDERDFTYNIDGVSLQLDSQMRQFKYPRAKKINYEELIKVIKKETENISEDLKEFAVKKYIGKIFYILLGNPSNYEEYEELDNIIDEITLETKECILNGKEIDINKLDTLTDELVKGFKQTKEEIQKVFANAKLKFATPANDIIIPLVNKIKEIEKDNEIDEKTKRIKIEVLLQIIRDNNKDKIILNEIKKAIQEGRCAEQNIVGKEERKH